jgi:hypothetical protein
LPRHPRQLRQPQAPQGASLAPSPSLVCIPLHADIHFLAQCRRGVLAKLTRQRLKRCVFKGIVDLQAAINRYLAETNENPKPFTLTADPDAIIEKGRRGKQALESIH